MKTKIRTFTDLTAWKHGHKLIIDIYQITSNFPTSEKYVLSSQMKKCGISITSNIAEGFSRKTKKEKVQFYYITLGSITELQNQLFICKDLGYIGKKEFENIFSDTITLQKLTNGLIKSSQSYT